MRVQLIGTNNLSVAEMQVFGCPVGQPCTDAYNFEDYSSSILDTIYGHIFGSIHCGCSADQLCGICGDGLTEADKGEECDE